MNWKKHMITFLLVFLVMGMLLSRRGGCPLGRSRGTTRPADADVVALALEGAPTDEGRLSPYSYTIRAELAWTPEQRKLGLGGRAGLDPGYGMLYVYEEAQQPEFSWQYTPFPLSVAFISADGTIVEIHSTQANDPVGFEPPEPVNYVLEVRSGWFADRNVAAGARFPVLAELAPAFATPDRESEFPPATEEAGVPADVPDPASAAALPAAARTP